MAAGTNRLQIYNDALVLCGQRFLATLNDNVESRRLLDNSWTSGAVNFCLEQGQWYFAMRFQQIAYDTSVTPQFGYTYAFEKPTDWILTSGIWSDERCRVPLSDMVDEANYWRADVTPLYVAFVSNDARYGNNLAIWPQTFEQYVAAYMASQVITKLTQDKQMIAALLTPRRGILDTSKANALNKAAMAANKHRVAISKWVLARVGARSGGPLGDGGNPGSLIG